jgi:hypothetical protein
MDIAIDRFNKLLVRQTQVVLQKHKGQLAHRRKNTLRSFGVNLDVKLIN